MERARLETTLYNTGQVEDPTDQVRDPTDQVKDPTDQVKSHWSG